MNPSEYSPEAVELLSRAFGDQFMLKIFDNGELRLALGPIHRTPDPRGLVLHFEASLKITILKASIPHRVYAELHSIDHEVMIAAQFIGEFLEEEAHTIKFNGWQILFDERMLPSFDVLRFL